jgi:hypothetical protein
MTNLVPPTIGWQAMDANQPCDMYWSTHLRTARVRIDTFGGPPDLLKLHLKVSVRSESNSNL